MAIVKRLDKGSALTYAELDGNFDHLTAEDTAVRAEFAAADVVLSGTLTTAYGAADDVAQAAAEATAQAALDAHTGDTSGAHAASAISYTPTGTVAATTAQAAIDEVVSDLAASSGSSLVGFLQSGTGANATTVQTKLREFVSVKDFGAVGDGVADDTVAIQAAIIAATTIGKITIPAGRYLVSATLEIDAGITIEGDGAQEYGDTTPGKSIIDYTGTGPAIKILGTGAEGKEGINLLGFSILGTASADGGIQIGTGIITKSTFKNLFISGFTNATEGKGYGIGCETVFTSIFENIYSYKNKDGFYMYGLTTTLIFTNCIARENERHGFYALDGLSNSLFSCVFESNFGYGLNLDAGSGKSITSWNIYSIYTENNSSKGTPSAQEDQTAINIDAAATGTVYQIHFFGGFVNEPGGTTSQAIVIGKAQNVWFHYTTVTSNSEDVIKVDATNTTLSGFHSYASNFDNVTGDAISSVTGVSNFQYRGNQVQGPIVFPSVQQTASNANTLDDYINGAFTPVYADAATGGNVAGTVTNGYGFYTKIGPIVTVTLGADSIDTTGMTAGEVLYIRGLPVAAAFPAYAPMQDIAASSTVPVAYVETGTYLKIKGTVSGTLSPLLVSNIVTNTTSFYITITYRAAH